MTLRNAQLCTFCSVDLKREWLTGFVNSTPGPHSRRAAGPLSGAATTNLSWRDRRATGRRRCGGPLLLHTSDIVIFSERPMTVYVFDLDYTLWPCWCDTHILAPVRGGADNTVVDRFGYTVSLYPDVERVLLDVRERGHPIVAASRTQTPHIATRMLNLFTVGGEPAILFFDDVQYGTGLKKRHIQRAAQALGLEKELGAGEFVLFDDENRNKDVRDIGVKFALCNNGLTWAVYQKHAKRAGDV